MELLKKTIKQAVTTGTTESCTGNCRVIIPDLSANYFVRIILTAKAFDFGFFDLYPYAYGYGDYENSVFGIGEDLLMDDYFI